jgi:hypothetical protein
VRGKNGRREGGKEERGRGERGERKRKGFEDQRGKLMERRKKEGGSIDKILIRRGRVL